MGLFELNKKFTVARENGFIFNQIVELRSQIYSNPSNINKQCYLKHRIPIMYRHFFRKLSQNPECNQTHCKDRKKFLHFAFCRWYLYNIPHY